MKDKELQPNLIIAQNIGELRKSMHLNKREFADLLAYNPSTITRLEQGEISNLDKIRYIAAKCNVNPLDLITNENKEDQGD